MIKSENLQGFLKEIENNIFTDNEYCFQKCAYLENTRFVDNEIACLLFNKKIKIAIENYRYARCKECLTYVGE